MFENTYHCIGHGWWVARESYEMPKVDMGGNDYLKDCPNHDGCEMSTLEVDA